MTAFDPARGLGLVLAEDGARLPFHAASIADGSRRVAIESDVVFSVAPGPGGRWEASDLSAAERADD